MVCERNRDISDLLRNMAGRDTNKSLPRSGPVVLHTASASHARQVEKLHYTEAGFSRDRRDEIEVPNPPSAPIEITNVHVYMDRKFPSLRDIKFKLRNRTSKKVVALSVTIGDKSGFAGMSGPYELEAKGQISLGETVAAYGDFCRGPFRHAMVVNDVSFADGSKWEFKEPAGSERTNE
jgi:hypothetical protein